MKQKVQKGFSPSKPNIVAKNTVDMTALLRDTSSVLDIPKECQDELAKKGLEGRWIDVVSYEKNRGYHKKGWRPYKFDCKLASADNPFAGSAGAYEGYLVRQQLVLAAKTIESARLDRQKVAAKTQLQANPAALKSKEMRDYVRNSGVNSTVTDDSDEPDDF